MKEFIFLHKVEFLVLIIMFSIIVNLILHYTWTKTLINAIINDTLKVNDNGVRRFSGTKMTMLTAFSSVLWAFHYIIIKYGFNETAFITMACIATGVGITGAVAKKVDPTIVAPDTKTTMEQQTNGDSTKTTLTEEKQ